MGVNAQEPKCLSTTGIGEWEALAIHYVEFIYLVCTKFKSESTEAYWESWVEFFRPSSSDLCPGLYMLTLPLECMLTPRLTVSLSKS